MIALIEYGAGNIASVKSALTKLSFDFREVSQSTEFPEGATSVLLPGVGDGSYMMEELIARGFDSVLKEWIYKDKPLLGICVGAQVLLEMTEEGDAPCLSVISGACRSMKEMLPSGVKIPHMGWNEVYQTDSNHLLFDSIPDMTSFYFVHSYYLSTSADNCLGTTNYHFDFASIIARERVIGLQFHPEKSGKWGLRMIDNFFTHLAGEGR